MLRKGYSATLHKQQNDQVKQKQSSYEGLWCFVRGRGRDRGSEGEGVRQVLSGPERSQVSQQII